MNRDRIKQRYFEHHNSLKRIAFDYQVSPAVVAEICGLYLTPRERAEQNGTLSNWLAGQDTDIQALIHWACKQADLPLDDLFKNGVGRAVRAIVAWHLIEVWGLGTAFVRELLGCSSANIYDLMQHYDPDGSDPCPVIPIPPSLPADYMPPLRVIARAYGVTTRGIYMRGTERHRQIWRVYAAEMVLDHGKTQKEVGEVLHVDKVTVRRAVRSAERTLIAQSQKDAA